MTSKEVDRMNKYRIAYDEAYLRSGMEQYRRKLLAYPWLLALKVVCGLGLAVLIALIVYRAFNTTNSTGWAVGITLALGVFLALLLQGPRLDHALHVRRLRSSSFYGDELVIAVSDDGVSFETPRSLTILKWAAFSAAYRTASGFLMYTDPKSAHWLPDVAQTEGTPADVKKLLGANIAAFKDE
jgi:YcxB-like protein